MHASSRVHLSIHPSKDVNKFFPATEKPFGGGKSMQTKRFKIYGGECTRLASIHPSIHPKLFINSTPRQKMFQSARAGKPKNWILYGGECAPLTSIHQSIHPSIHPRLSTNSSRRRKTLSEGKSMRTKRFKIYGGECTPPLTSIHPSIHPSKAQNEFFPATKNLSKGERIHDHDFQSLL